MKPHTFEDYLLTIEMVVIGLAEAAHLTGVFLKRSFLQCAMLFWILVCAATVGGVGFLIIGLLLRRHSGKSAQAQRLEKRPGTMVEMVLYLFFAFLLLSQLIFICAGNNIYRQGDMTVETVESILASDRIYQVNPMTGGPYTEGIPTRLKILCLPTLYGSICEMTGLQPERVVWTVMPIVILCSCYVAFAVLGRSLFPEEGDLSYGKKRACFMAVAALLLWVGAYRYGMDGFNMLCSGWRGVSIRNGVLAPWLLSLCLRKKWLSVILCVLAEACIVWTLYGCGVCLVIAAGMAAAQFFCHKWTRGTCAERTRNSK